VSDSTKATVIGAAPEGVSDPASAALAVREMFSSIAPRYDLLNHLLSFNVDRLWWRKTARSFASILKRQDAQVLDLCCGTGDMTFALFREAGGSAKILGVDFSHAMLQRANEKSAERSLRWVEADALQLPFPDEQFDYCSIWLPQSRGLRCRTAGNGADAASRRGMRNPGFW
jgi:demethylmenaquinone methyltransferase / 2-methoxy-6-polyprenyl-1,4-benzoquinol methylase